MTSTLGVSVVCDELRPSDAAENLGDWPGGLESGVPEPVCMVLLCWTRLELNDVTHLCSSLAAFVSFPSNCLDKLTQQDMQDSSPLRNDMKT